MLELLNCKLTWVMEKQGDASYIILCSMYHNSPQPIQCIMSYRDGKNDELGRLAVEFLMPPKKLITTASKIGNLYHLNCYSHQVNVVDNQCRETKEDVWHQRLVHLGKQNLRKLTKSELVIGFDYDVSNASVSLVLRENTTGVDSQMMVVNSPKSPLDWFIAMCAGR